MEFRFVYHRQVLRYTLIDLTTKPKRIRLGFVHFGPVTKKRIWFESCFVCDECEKDASRAYDQFSFVPPYQK